MLTFIVPLAFITTFPAGALFGESTMLPRYMPPHYTPLVAVLVAAVLLVASNRFWHFGLRHYSGASG